jgi:hypothetical protein
VKDGKQSSTELLTGVTVPELMLMPGIMAKIQSVCNKGRYAVLVKFGDEHKSEYLL